MSLFIPSISSYTVDIPDIVDFATGTNEQLYKMLQAHYAGTINIHDHWNVGDTRTVHLNAMAATGVGESHAEQDVEIVLMNAGGMTDISGTECAFVWGMKNCLNETGYMNSTGTNSGGWPATARARKRPRDRSIPLSREAPPPRRPKCGSSNRPSSRRQ